VFGIHHASHNQWQLVNAMLARASPWSMLTQNLVLS
jgi:hypothetical protein